MKILNLIQGTPEWHAHRATHFNASDAPAMMGCSKYETRAQLIHRLHTGISPEIDARTQRRFDDGHRFEALCRPLAEKIIGEDLYPVTGSEGKLSASFDGLTMDESVAFEHKTLNDELRAALMSDAGAAALALAYRVQMEQQCMVSGAKKVLFMASKWDGEDCVDALHAWYDSDPELAARIVMGWEQLERDVSAYVPAEAAEPAPVGRAPDALPALHIVLKGEVSASNLAEFKEVALTAIRSVNRDLKTDQDFADSAKARKWCEDIEARVSAAKDHALSQTMSIDLLFRTMDEVSAEAREVRLALEKLEKARKETRKGEIVLGAGRALVDHITSLNQRIGKAYMPVAQVDFAGAVKGLKTFDSMQNAVDTALAAGKIAASATADRIELNLKHLAAAAADHIALFPDLATICTKEAQDFEALVQFRVAEQRRKDEARAEQQRARIAEEERVKAEAKVRAEQEAQRRDDEALEHVQAAQAVQQTATIAPPAPAAAPAVIAMPTRAAAPTAAPTLSLGKLGTRLGFSLTADFLRSIGFEPAGRERAAVLYHESSFGEICAALVKHLESLQAKQAA